MAAAGNNSIRVRLHFDYAPPAVTSCRMCWLLVDLNRCRVVADLESIIREKFDLSHRNILNLFIEECYLPHTESIYVVRDNDNVRVEVSNLTPVNGRKCYPDTPSEKSRKRRRHTEEDRLAENRVRLEQKKEKRIKRSEECLQRDTKTAEDERDSQGKNIEKKKRKGAEQNAPTGTLKTTATPKKRPGNVDQAVQSTKKPSRVKSDTQNIGSSDPSDSSSEEEEAPKTMAAQKEAPKRSSSTPTTSKVHPNTKLPTVKPHRALSSSSSSSETDSSSEPTSRKSTAAPQSAASATPKDAASHKSYSCQRNLSCLPSTHFVQKSPASAASPQAQKEQPESYNSNAEEEIELVIRRPIQQLCRGTVSQPLWQDRGCRKVMNGGGPGERGRGECRGDIRGQSGSFELSCDGEQHVNGSDSPTKSAVLQNRTESTPKQDYSSMPLLAAPPQVGQKIAFKLLELSENYTPEVSEYKEGKILSFDPTTKQIEVEVLNASEAPVEPGKFDLVYQNPDGTERVEYAVSRGTLVTESWDSLLLPRLIV
ncbi:hypothetical protein LDENG_00220900 [Lucifuga dentata]|nr:hypothetical protein LDENG_00220900 [Lucifuga dentata]